ncbi:hypothetical protein N9X61_03565 [Sulfurimonas sp.]|nr:hypothetical protein [Sulfurimonas sp.]
MRFILGVLLFSSFCFADEYFIISNKKIDTLSRSQVKAIYLKKLHFINDVRIVPLNLELKHPLRKKFEKNILKMGFIQLKSYWNKQHYLGKRPPLNMKSQEAILAFVKKVDGSIAYIDAQPLDNSLNILYKWED